MSNREILDHLYESVKVIYPVSGILRKMKISYCDFCVRYIETGIFHVLRFCGLPFVPYDEYLIFKESDVNENG